MEYAIFVTDDRIVVEGIVPPAHIQHVNQLAKTAGFDHFREVKEVIQRFEFRKACDQPAAIEKVCE